MWSLGSFPSLNALGKSIGKCNPSFTSVAEECSQADGRKGEAMENSILASPYAGAKAKGPRKLLAKAIAAMAIAVFWCISAVGTTVGTAVGTTVGATTLAAAVTAATSTTAEAGRRRRRRRRRRRGRGGPWFWFWW